MDSPVKSLEEGDTVDAKSYKPLVYRRTKSRIIRSRSYRKEEEQWEDEGIETTDSPDISSSPASLDLPEAHILRPTSRPHAQYKVMSYRSHHEDYHGAPDLRKESPSSRVIRNMNRRISLSALHRKMLTKYECMSFTSSTDETGSENPVQWFVIDNLEAQMSVHINDIHVPIDVRSEVIRNSDHLDGIDFKELREIKAKYPNDDRQSKRSKEISEEVLNLLHTLRNSIPPRDLPESLQRQVSDVLHEKIINQPRSHHFKWTLEAWRSRTIISREKYPTIKAITLVFRRAPRPQVNFIQLYLKLGSIGDIINDYGLETGKPISCYLDKHTSAGLAHAQRFNDRWSSYLNIQQPMASARGLTTREDMDDLSDSPSTVSDTDSVLSLGAGISGSLISSGGIFQGVSNRLVQLLIDDTTLGEVYQEALKTLQLGRFERNYRRCLQHFAIQLQTEAFTSEEATISKIVRYMTKDTAHEICNFVWEHQEATYVSSMKKTHPGENVADDNGDEGGVFDDSDNELDFAQLERFIRESRAFEIFKGRLRAFVQRQASKKLKNSQQDEGTNEKLVHQSRWWQRPRVPTILQALSDHISIISHLDRLIFSCIALLIAPYANSFLLGGLETIVEHVAKSLDPDNSWERSVIKDRIFMGINLLSTITILILCQKILSINNITRLIISTIGPTNIREIIRDRSSRLVYFCSNNATIIKIGIAYHKFDTMKEYISRKYKTFSNILRREPPIPEGKVRIRWKCSCGKESFDDVIELEEGAAKQLEEELNQSSRASSSNSGSFSTKSVINLGRSLSQSMKSLRTTFWAKDTSLNQLELGNQAAHPQPHEPPISIPDPLFLLLCRPQTEHVHSLLQPDIRDVKSDKDLFLTLQSNYKTTSKSLTSYFSFRTIKSIRFVHFELYLDGLTSILTPHQLPPPNNPSYRYKPTPPTLIPPIPSNILMHKFLNPSCCKEKDSTCFDRIPKKLHHKLEIDGESGTEFGWGLQFVEDWNGKVWDWVLAGFGAASVVFVAVWWKVKGDLQGAAGMGGFMLAWVAVSVGVVQANGGKVKMG